MDVQPTSGTIKVTSWEELIEILNTPARLPKFPDFSSAGNWSLWSPNSAPPSTRSFTVEQPKHMPSQIRRLFSKGRQCCRPLQFKPLPEGYIRLLDMKNAKIHEDVLVGFNLITVPLTKAPHYEAISYCWGSTELCTGILLSTQYHKNQVYRVTENLATCLYSLLVADQPEADRPRYVWVDQICINQNDVHERNSQVRRMAEVYKTAARVIVWLGQRPDYSLEELDFELPNQHTIWEGKSLLNWALEWAIFGRPWFSRLWVFQEAAFARRISVLLGTVFTPWETLRARYLTLAGFQVDVFRGKLPSNDQVFSDLNYMVVASIEDTVKKLTTQTYVDLGFLMWRLDGQGCQDPRDRVFSLVGFAGDTLPVDFVNYSHHIDVINQDCTRRMIAQTGSLKAITWMNPETQERSPSWVPLWHTKLWASMNLDFGDTCASLKRKWKPTSPAVGGQLVVSGKEIDAIGLEVHSFRNNVRRYFKNRFASVLHEPFRDALTQRLHFLKERCQHELSADIQPGSQQETSDPEPYSEALSEFFRCFFRTVFYSFEETLMEEDFDILIRSSNGEEALARLQDLMKFGTHSPGALCVLKSGRLGFLHYKLQDLKGDESIVILHGHDIPCVLRRAEDGENWLLVAEMWIPDIMHGEAVDWEEDDADTFLLV
ncbi:heterokaryon incompatibility protein [Stagonosporopsis vannaccii]|nr:heterokaryon incompatibility protein [Stagonosporopsis vannaccii]